jgi:hypothetical protein
VRPEVDAGGDANAHQRAHTGRVDVRATASADAGASPGTAVDACRAACVGTVVKSLNSPRGDRHDGCWHRCSGQGWTCRSWRATTASTNPAASGHACVGDADCVKHGANT